MDLVCLLARNELIPTVPAGLLAVVAGDGDEGAAQQPSAQQTLRTATMLGRAPRLFSAARGDERVLSAGS